MTDIESIARRHDVPLDAANRILESLARNGGRMAQFSHPALGGMGQWHDGGMTMIGDMFNDALKSRVSALCSDLVPLALLKPRSSSTTASGAWWPSELGNPSSTGSQNNARYAVFPETRRLAIETDSRVTIFDTGKHLITGASQQQGSGSDISFASQLGIVRAHELVEVSVTSGSSAPTEAKATERPSRQASHNEPRPYSDTPAKTAVSPEHDGLSLLERLFELHQRGVLTDAEFSAKKAELLSRI